LVFDTPFLAGHGARALWVACKGVTKRRSDPQEKREPSRHYLSVSALSAFLAESIDDAGLFPPAQLSMIDALAAHERYEASPEYWMIGRFIAPAARAGELMQRLESAPHPLSTSFVLDGVESLAHLAVTRDAPSVLALEAFECRFASLPGATPDERLRALFEAAHAAGFSRDLPAYVELDARDTEGLAPALAALARMRERGYEACAKLRCGGLTADAAPAPGVVAAFLWEANRLRVPFKATAGLHHPVRGFNEEAGFPMHGFLNVIGGAVLACARGLDRTTLERLVADENAASFRLEAERFAWSGIGADAAEVGQARAQFVHAFGSCSFEEPIADLYALGILEPQALRPQPNLR